MPKKACVKLKFPLSIIKCQFYFLFFFFRHMFNIKRWAFQRSNGWSNDERQLYDCFQNECIKNLWEIIMNFKQNLDDWVGSKRVLDHVKFKAHTFWNVIPNWKIADSKFISKMHCFVIKWNKFEYRRCCRGCRNLLPYFVWRFISDNVAKCSVANN